MAYYVVYAPDDTVTAISIFNNHAGAEESNRRGLAWSERNLAPLLIGPASAVAGPVIVHTLAEKYAPAFRRARDSKRSAELPSLRPPVQRWNLEGPGSRLVAA